MNKMNNKSIEPTTYSQPKKPRARKRKSKKERQSVGGKSFKDTMTKLKGILLRVKNDTGETEESFETSFKALLGKTATPSSVLSHNNNFVIILTVI